MLDQRLPQEEESLLGATLIKRTRKWPATTDAFATTSPSAAPPPLVMDESHYPGLTRRDSSVWLRMSP